MNILTFNYMRVLDDEEIEDRKREQERKDKELVEAIAEIQHQAWMHWSKDIANTRLNVARLKRWKGFWIPYKDLPEDTKALDRLWAWKILEIIKAKT